MQSGEFIDFGELLLRTYELIDGNEKILNHYKPDLNTS